jgi:23S rRNA (uracil1939-C5)-methyltransferase
LPAPPQIVGMRVFYSDPRTPAAVGTSLLHAHGSPILEEVVLGRPFRFSDRSFFQINIPVYEKALSDIRNFVAPDVPVYDLYAGVGTIGITVGGAGVVFVESDEETAVFLRENCLQNNMPDPTIFAAPAEKALTAVPTDATVILDPPRAGVHPRVIRRVAESLPRRIIYLSCNPTTQGQDLAALLERYHLAFFRAYNFFPRTPHIETLAVLDRSRDADPVSDVVAANC